jgi:hypothetical protein
MDGSSLELYAGITSSGVFKTIDDAGERWQQLTSLPASGFGRIALAIARPGQAHVIYAGFDANGRYRLFRSTSHGAAWNELPSPPSEEQLNFGNVLAVGLRSSDSVYVGQVALWQAADGGRRGGLNDFGRRPPVTGNSWTNLSCCLGDGNASRTGLDLHADLHDVVLAPRGSFQESTSTVEVLFVAGDGGITKGVMNDVGSIFWRSLTRGISVGQCGRVGLGSDDPDLFTTGVWHCGTVLAHTAAPDPVLIGGVADGFQARIDAGGGPSTVVYFNCNAGGGGSVCRAVTLPHLLQPGRVEEIWQTSNGTDLWTDPYRVGHLFRLEGGVLFRTDHADSQPAAELHQATAWTAIEPPGKTGQTITMGFDRRRAFDTPIVYYLGTSAGQLWRGSPEVGFEQLPDVGAVVRGIGVDLNLSDRIAVVLDGATSPGRIRLLERGSDGAWRVTVMDDDFQPELRVDALTCIVFDPGPPTQSDSHTVYVGTDQGLYVGRFENHRWVWERALGVPDVWVSDLQVHDGFAFTRPTGVVRAATWGRGIFGLTRLELVPIPEPPFRRAFVR